MIQQLRTDNFSSSRLSFKVVSGADDLPDIITLARAAHMESRFRDIPFSEEKVRKIALKALSKPKQSAVLLAYKDKTPVGFAYCSVGEYHIGSGVLLTTIHNINVVKDVRASLSGGKIALSLFKGVETWSKARNAREIFLHVSSGVNLGSIHALAKKMGFVFVGGSYAKQISD